MVLRFSFFVEEEHPMADAVDIAIASLLNAHNDDVIAVLRTIADRAAVALEGKAASLRRFVAALSEQAAPVPPPEATPPRVRAVDPSLAVPEARSRDASGSRRAAGKRKPAGALLSFRGRRLSASAWSHELSTESGLPTDVIYTRLRRGRSIEDAISKPIDRRRGRKREKAAAKVAVKAQVDAGTAVERAASVEAKAKPRRKMPERKPAVPLAGPGALIVPLEDAEEALRSPRKVDPRDIIEHDGRRLSVKQWAAERGDSTPFALIAQLAAGMSMAAAMARRA
jgi:hypothetical protein